MSEARATEGAMLDVSEPALRRTMIAVVFGVLMSMLDTTIVNIAIRTLSVRLHGDLPSVQWVVTGYLLALAGVLPLAGWLCDRFGARRVYVCSIAIFTLASAACGLSRSLDELIAFRVLQGAAGAVTMPAGQMILVRVAGRERMARVMGTLTIPIVMAPIFGPVIGGFLLEHAGWQWIFLVNLPFGLAAVPLALWLLPRDRTGRSGQPGAIAAGSRLPDVLGLLLISGGTVAVTYGLASAGSQTLRVVVPVVVGAALLAAFAVRSARIAHPLLDVRLYRSPAYAASSLMNFALGATVFGAMILMPLYYQAVRHQDPVVTGLLVAPAGIGVALFTRVASHLTDRIGSGRTALVGGLIGAAGTIPFLFLGPDTSYLWLSLAGVVRGAGIALCMIPAMAAVYRAIPPEKISDGTTQVSVLNRLGGSTGTALFTVALQHALAGRATITSAATAASTASAYGDAFRWALGAVILAILPAALLAVIESRAGQREPKPPVAVRGQPRRGLAERSGKIDVPATTRDTRLPSLAPNYWLSNVVNRRRCGVSAARWQGPANDARLRLVHVPAGGLLHLVVPPALGSDVALAAQSVRIGNRVIQVAVDGLGGAAGGGARSGTGSDQVLEFAARDVAVLSVMVIAGVLGDGGEGHSHPAKQLG
jgi:EmrB/QacA subfamily drug resistance transporter